MWRARTAERAAVQGRVAVMVEPTRWTHLYADPGTLVCDEDPQLLSFGLPLRGHDR